jgi:hypothetical protein
MAQVEKVDMSRAVPVPVEDVCHSNTYSNNDINSSNSSTNAGEIGEGTRRQSVS